jgi:hypothetical protein
MFELASTSAVLTPPTPSQVKPVANPPFVIEVGKGRFVQLVHPVYPEAKYAYVVGLFAMSYVTLGVPFVL